MIAATAVCCQGEHGRGRRPIFARAFHQLTRLMEPEIAGCRDELLGGLTGSVLELGAGNGIGFAHYPDTVEQVVAIEPEPYLRAKAVVAAAQAPLAITVMDGLADALPLQDASVDAAVCSLVLCSVPDALLALGELRRVLRSGGELRFFEHVRSADPRRARLQRAVDRSGAWRLLAGGCHCARDTSAAIQASGFWIERSRAFAVGPGWLLTNPYVLGRALAV